MRHSQMPDQTGRRPKVIGICLAIAIAVMITGAVAFVRTSPPQQIPVTSQLGRASDLPYVPRQDVDSAGFGVINSLVKPWPADATLEQIRDAWDGVSTRKIEELEAQITASAGKSDQEMVSLYLEKASLLNYEGEAKKAYQALEQARSLIEKNDEMATKSLYSTIFLQGVTALRRGENENCIMCRGESSCIIPISPAAVHKNPTGSRLAIKHFIEYLDRFPDDLGVQWLLNLAHMTLAEHPDRVEPKYLVSLDRFRTCEFDIGRFRDVGHIVGLNQFTQAGGAIMEDFDNDGLLDIVVTTLDPTGPMSMLKNTGEGNFQDRTIEAGLMGQLGGLNCVQADYNNDGYMDIYIVRGAWLEYAMPPTLLRNNKDGSFSDVTQEAGLLHPVNSICAQWADYDNDGWLDLFVGCEKQPSQLFHNHGNGTFEEVSDKVGLLTRVSHCKGVTWIDYDNDGFPDLFLNYLMERAGAQLFHNNRDGTFRDVTSAVGIDGPAMGFSCWAWDYDNDGWTDIFATSYRHVLGDIIKGLRGEPSERGSNRLYRNMRGMGFKDVTREVGLDMVFATMGSNFGDFDNDGYLDMYLGTGDPLYSTLVPNRMFKNVGGRRFSEITASAGTGNLQKGHGVACGDWDRDGDVDIFIEMGGAVVGDKYHNILFQNPGQAFHSLTVKLVGEKTNRAAIGARIKLVTDGEKPQTIYRHVTSGSSFGANPLQQTIGVGTAKQISRLEITWPTSHTIQVFENVDVNQAIEITEFGNDYRKLNWKPISLSKEPVSTMSAELR